MTGSTSCLRAGCGVATLAVLLAQATSAVSSPGDGGGSGDGGESDGGSTSAAAEAQQRLAEGNRLLREARYAEAIQEYQAAFALVPRSKIHFNIGVAQKMRGDAVRAATELDLFLDAPGDADEDFRADATRYLEELSGKVSTVWTRSVATDGSVSVDGVLVPDPTHKRPIRLTPGRHLLLVHGTGTNGDWTRTLDLAPGASIAIAPEIVLPATTSTPSVTASSPSAIGTRPARRPFYRRWWFWAAAGVGLAGIGLVTALALRNDGCNVNEGCYTLMMKNP